MPIITRALLSVTDKTDIDSFARALNQDFGVELISTGGTAKLLREAGVPVRDVSDVTSFPEMLDGRVKTMHPKITGGILAMRSNAAHMAALHDHHIQPIDLVVVNLYQFEKVAASADAPLHQLIENIDIGGPTMIRSAAKNYQDVAVVVSPSDYDLILAEMRENGGDLTATTRWRLAQKAFRTPRNMTGPSARVSHWSGTPLQPLRFPIRWIFAQPSVWTCVMVRIHISLPHSTEARWESRAENRSAARNFPTTTWWTSTPRGSWRRNSPDQPPRSSNIPTPAAAVSRTHS